MNRLLTSLFQRSVSVVVVAAVAALPPTVWGQETPPATQEEGTAAAPGVEESFTPPPPSEPGSFFRSPAPAADAPPAESGELPPGEPNASAFTAAPAAEETADGEDAGAGMSGFSDSPPFAPPAATGDEGLPPPSFSAPAAEPTPDAAEATPPAASFPPPAATPDVPATPPASLGFAPPTAVAAPLTNTPQSVLTAPPEEPSLQQPQSVAVPPASTGFAPVAGAGEGLPAAAAPPAALQGMGSAGAVAGNSAADVSPEQTLAMPTGPATTLIAEALAVVEAGGGPAMLVELAARPLPLLEALERSGDRGRRLWITQAYWKVVEKVAVLRWTAEAADRLDLVAPSGDPHDRATLDVAVASRLADVAAARAALVVAQQELVDLARLPAGEPLPWPVDRPLATSYETHFDVLFASRIATGRIRAIHRVLPLEHEEVDARAAAVLAAQTALEMAENDHARGTRGIEAVITSHAALLEQQQALAKAVSRYNDDIVEYVMAVADFSVPDEQFAAMLIGAPTPWRPAVTLTSASAPVVGVPTLAPPPAAAALGGTIPPLR